MRILRRILLWVLFPMGVGYALRLYSSPFLAGLVDHLAELSEWGAKAGLAAILASEVMENVLKDSFVPAIVNEFRQFAETAIRTIADKGVLIRNEFAPSALVTSADSPKELAEAKSLLIRGETKAAIAKARGLAEAHPKHRLDYVNILLASHDPAEWKKGENVLEAIGDPQAYLRLAYNKWHVNDHEGAITAAARALELAKEKADPTQVISASNSLAYYYADAETPGKGPIAIKLAEAAVEARRAQGQTEDQVALARALGTLGYVRVTYAASLQDVIKGMRECEDARRMGADLTLYFRHMYRAQERLQKLS